MHTKITFLHLFPFFIFCLCGLHAAEDLDSTLRRAEVDPGLKNDVQTIKKYRQQIKQQEAQLPNQNQTDINNFVTNLSIDAILKSVELPQLALIKPYIENILQDRDTKLDKLKNASQLTPQREKEILLDCNRKINLTLKLSIILSNRINSENVIVVSQKTEYLEEELRQLKDLKVNSTKYQPLEVISERWCMISLTFVSIIACCLSFWEEIKKMKKKKSSPTKEKNEKKETELPSSS